MLSTISRFFGRREQAKAIDPSAAYLSSLPTEVLLLILQYVELSVRAEVDGSLPSCKAPVPAPENPTLIPGATRCLSDPNYRYICHDSAPSIHELGGAPSLPEFSPYYYAIKKALDGLSRSNKRLRDLVLPIYFEEVSIVPRTRKCFQKLAWILNPSSSHILPLIKTMHLIIWHGSSYIEPNIGKAAIKKDEYRLEDVSVVAQVLSKAQGLNKLVCKLEPFGFRLAKDFRDEMDRLGPKLPVKTLYACPGNDWLLDFCDNVQEFVLDGDKGPAVAFHRQGYRTTWDVKGAQYGSMCYDFSSSIRTPLETAPSHTTLLIRSLRTHTITTFIFTDGFINTCVLDIILEAIPNVKYLSFGNYWFGSGGVLDINRQICTETSKLKDLVYLNIPNLPSIYVSDILLESKRTVAQTWAMAPSLKTLEISDLFWWEIERNEDGSMDIYKSQHGNIKAGKRTFIQEDLGNLPYWTSRMDPSLIF